MFRPLHILVFLLSACQKGETISGYVNSEIEFRLVEISGKPFTSNNTISFPEQRSVVGKGPCNSYATTQSAPLPWFEVGPIRATKMACSELAVEGIYFDLLSRMTLAETSGNIVILRNDADEELVFEALQE